MDLGYQRQAFLGFDVFYAVNARRFLSLVVLGDPSHR
jgi:hypothetical protein